MNKKIALLTSPSCSFLPRSREAEQAYHFLAPLMERGTTPFFDNLKTKMHALLLDDVVLPISVNEAEYENSYVCSPYGQYVRYAKEQLSTLSLPLLQNFCQGIVKSLDPFCKRGEINKIVWVNNWLVSTNLYPQLTHEQLVRATHYLSRIFPDHAIGFRSLHEQLPLFQPHALTKEGFLLIPSRYVYLLDTESKKPFQARMFRSDVKLLEKSDYSVIDHKEIREADIPRIVSLYKALYIEKYSPLSPQITPSFIQLALQKTILEMKALKKGEQIDAIVGYSERGGWMTSPLFGYDPAIPQKEGLYRMLSTLVTLEAKKRGVWLNQSSGAGSFKRLRRAKDVMEWSAVYVRHLPWSRQLPWKILRWAMQTIGLPIMKRLEQQTK